MSTPASSIDCPPGVRVYDFRNFSTAFVDSRLHPSLDKILLTIVMPIVWVIGLTANLAFIYVVVRHRFMRTLTNVYLLNLAIADIMFLSFAEGEKIGRYIASPLKIDMSGYKAAGCVLINFFIQLSFYASIFLVTVVTFDKYYAVCRPIRHRLVTGRKRTISMVSAAWVLASVFAASLIPAWVKWKSRCVLWPELEQYDHVPNLFGFCQSVSPVMVTVANGLQPVPFFIVMTANIVMYALIIRAVNASRFTAREKQQGAADERRIQMRNQVARMLIANGTIFFLTLSPFQFTAFGLMITGAIDGKLLLSKEDLIKVMWTGRILSYINSAINPFVYTLVNSRYRKAFLEVFASCQGIREKLTKKADLDDGGTPNGTTGQVPGTISDNTIVISTITPGTNGGMPACSQPK